MREPRDLKVRTYDDCMIYLNYYLAVSPGGKASEKNREKELNEIVLNIMPNICIRQTYVKGFNGESITYFFL